MSRNWDDIKDLVVGVCADSTSMAAFLQSVSRLRDQETTYSAARHAWKRWQEGDPDLRNMSDVLGSDLIGSADLTQIEMDLHKAQRKGTKWKKKAKRTMRELAAAEARLEVLLGTQDAEVPKISSPKTTAGKKRNGVAVVLASDWHVEETVDPKEVNNRNTYNPTIAELRSRKFFEGVEWLLNFHQTGFNLDHLVLWIGGDMISGYIHDELMESNAMAPVEAILFVQSLIVDGINFLLKNTKVKKITVPCSYGNHGRTGEKRANNAAHNSFEWLMYHNLRSLFKGNDKVEFVIADGSHLYMEIYDWTVRFHHGDTVRYAGGVGGLAVPMRKALDAWNDFQHADITCVGHFHQHKDLGDVVVNGSLIGYNAFAMSIKARYEPPRQTFFMIDEKRGKCHVTPIWVDEGE